MVVMRVMKVVTGGGGAGGLRGLARLHTSPPLAVAPGRKDTASSPEASSTNLAYVSYETPKQEQRQPPLIIQHGLFGRKENFTGLGRRAHHLTRRSVLVPDLRNHGESPPCRNMTLRQMSSDLVRLTSHLGVSRAAILGHATGGRVAMYTALTRPELVTRLVVASSSPLDTTASLARWRRNRRAMEVMRDMLAPLSPDTRAGLGALDSSDEGSDEGQGGVEFKLEANAALKDILTDPSERALFLSNLGKVNVEALLGSSPDLASFPDMQGQTFEGPALFITGEREPVWGGDSEVRSIRTLFPNSHFVKVPGASHWAHTEASDEFLAATVSFLQTPF